MGQHSTCPFEPKNDTLVEHMSTGTDDETEDEEDDEGGEEEDDEEEDEQRRLRTLSSTSEDSSDSNSDSDSESTDDLEIDFAAYGVDHSCKYFPAIFDVQETVNFNLNDRAYGFQENVSYMKLPTGSYLCRCLLSQENLRIPLPPLPRCRSWTRHAK